MSALRLNPYPSHYRTAFAFSLILYPQFLRYTLRLPAHLLWENYGLTVFILSDRMG